MEGTSVNRRLIQSTLFPHRDPPAKETGKEEEVPEEEVDDGGSAKKRRETKKKVNPKKKSPAAPSKKAMEREISEKQPGEGESPVIIAKSDFFTKVSEKRQQKRNDLILIDSPERTDDICSPPISAANEGTTPRKPNRRNKSNNSTPRKERTSTPRKERTSTPNKKTKSGAKALCSGHIPFDLNMEYQPPQTIPDLRLEAKQKAEENSRMYSGKQIHPFFTSIKGGKANQGSSSQEYNLSSSERKEKGIMFNPIHVLGNVEVDHVPLEWGDWVFSERRTMDRPEYGCSPPVNEKSVATMNFDGFNAASHINRSSLYQNSTPKTQVSDRLPDQSDSSHCSSSLPLADKTEKWDEEKELNRLPNDILGTTDDLMLLDHKPVVRTSENLSSELQEKLLQERITSTYHTSQSTPGNCLWTDKYQPQSGNQICGNSESVKHLSEWLNLWHQRGSRASRNISSDEVYLAQGYDSDYQQSDSDSDMVDGDNSLKNVLLVTGPIGCGKSAAIYACARDQGFQIIEINASDWRSGALIKQKFREAVESHWNQRVVETTPSSDKKAVPEYFTVVKTRTQCPDDEVIELIGLSDENDPRGATACQKTLVSGENGASNYRNEIKTLILFEDVDIILCEDQGFLTAIQQLAETAKRPMILTSNSDNPVLPKNLERSELNFTLPSKEELLQLLYVICAAENIKLKSCLIERFVDYCQGDIRKTIMLLQFWFQSLTLGPGYGRHLTYSPVPFDLDAGHHILPKLIPWAYHSKLSELVDMEVVESLHLVDATHGSFVTHQGADPINCRAENIHTSDGLYDPFEAKKEAMLNLHHSSQDEAVGCAEFQDEYELSGSPVTFARKNRRKINAVLSDSDDEFLGCSTIVSDGLLDINVELEEMKCFASSICLNDGVSHHPTGGIYMETQEESFHVIDVCRSPDMSFVPESSFVPETEFFNESNLHSASVSYGHFAGAEAKFIIPNQDPLPTPEPAAATSQFNGFLNNLHDEQEILASNSSANAAHMFQEEVGDSISKSAADVSVLNRCRILDECSRVNFRRLKSLSNCEAEKEIDYVQEAWNRLHDPCRDLSKHVTEGEKTASQLLKLAHGMTNLISEADLMLKDCQTVISDSWRSSLIPSEKVHSYSFYDNQLEISSVLAQHGTCLYAKEITSLGSIMGSTNRLDLASEMLSNSSSSIALGKLASHDQGNVCHMDVGAPEKSNILTSDTDSFCSILQSIVPSRSYLAAKGYAYHEYMSTLSQISRFEASRQSRVSDCIGKRSRRQGRVAQHYLSSGSLAMSPEEISLLGESNSYKRISSLGD